MPRYFFDIHDGRIERDEVGFECADLQAAAKHAKDVLPEIVAHEVPTKGERQAFTVLVSDEDSHPIYLGALTYTGTWLIR